MQHEFISGLHMRQCCESAFLFIPVSNPEIKMQHATFRSGKILDPTRKLQTGEVFLWEPFILIGTRAFWVSDSNQESKQTDMNTPYDMK